MSRFRSYLSHPFWGSLLVLVFSYLGLKFGIGYLLPAVGVHSAPVPSSVLLQYMLTVFVAILLYVSTDEGRWRAFKQPIRDVMVDPARRTMRAVLLVAFPVLAGLVTYGRVRAEVGAPPSLRSIHPAPPNDLTFRGERIRLTSLQNPLRESGLLEERVRTGGRLYVQNCVPCHGDRLDGKGPAAHALNPVPADFTDNGTISQLTESYVFWRIAKGGPGLPVEGAPWNSAMPVWEDILTADEIWSVILFIYERSGSRPRTWEEAEGTGEGDEG